MNLRAQKVLIGSMKSTWKPAPSGVPRWPVLAPMLFNSFINGLDDRTKCTIGKAADYTKLRGVVDTPDGFAAIQEGHEQSGDMSKQEIS